MIDFGALRASIHDDADLPLFDEAVKCLHGGALRAAFVFAWIATAEGLLHKLDQMGAAQADIARFVTTFKAGQEAGSGQDATLLDQAAKVGFVDITEKKALDGVRDLRNQYGHPTSTAPTEAMAATAIELAVNAVLSKPALLLHGGARQLAERIGTDPHYLPNDAAAVAGWTAARVSLIGEAARPLFIQTLVQQHEANLGQIDDTLADRCLVSAVTALAEWQPDLSGAAWRVDKLQQTHGQSAAAVFSDESVWDLLTENDQYQILSRCLEVPTNATDPRLTNLLLSHAFALWNNGALNDVQTKLITDRVGVIDGHWLIRAGAPTDLLLTKATGYLEHGSFDENKNGTVLLDGLSEAALAAGSAAELEAAGAALAKAARRNAYVAINLAHEIVSGTGAWPEPFRIGFAVEGATQPWLFNDKVAATQAMRLALSDVKVAVAVEAAVAGIEEQHVGFYADDVIAGIESRIDDDEVDLDTNAVSTVRRILSIAEHRYQAVHGETDL